MKPAPTKLKINFENIGKRFPGTVALQNVSFEVTEGTCHALVGENGAGKSTLGKILAGIHRPDAGSIQIGGVECQFSCPLDAQSAGVGIVHQELSFCPNLSVAENICLSRLPRRGLRVDWPGLLGRAQAWLDEVGARFDVRQEIRHLSIGQVQLVQIAAALATGAQILVMDEPTSSLSFQEARKLMDLITRLKLRGITTIYVSHRMDEIFAVCDTVTVLRDGQHVTTKPVRETSEDELIGLMVGRHWKKFVATHTDRPGGDERLRVEGLDSPGKFCNVDFTVHAGEVLGVAGLVGSGRTEVVLALFGMDPGSRGRVLVNGSEARIGCPKDALRHGIGLVTEDRKQHGLVLGMSCGQNVSLGSLPRLSRFGIINSDEERNLILSSFKTLRVKASSPDTPAMALSGGNQQKLVLAKWLAHNCQILILDEPTRGVDVGAKVEIHRLIDELASAGLAILMISSELPEILDLSTRVMVMRQGRVAGIVHWSTADEGRIMELMAGSREAAGRFRSN